MINKKRRNKYIREWVMLGHTRKEAAEMYGVSPSFANKICMGLPKNSAEIDPATWDAEFWKQWIETCELIRRGESYASKN